MSLTTLSLSKFASATTRTKNKVFGYIRETESAFSINIPMLIKSVIVIFCAIGLALSMITKCEFYTFDEHNRTVHRHNHCFNSEHNHSIFIDQIIDSSKSNIYKWTFKINKLHVTQNISFGLIANKKDLSWTTSINTYRINKQDENDLLHSFATIAISQLKTNDKITFVYNVSKQTLYFHINNATVHEVYTNITRGPQYRFAIYLHDNDTQIAIEQPEQLSPAPNEAKFSNTCQFKFEYCFHCKKEINCTDMHEVINHLLNDYQQCDKTWRICDVSTCKQFNKPFENDKKFVYHLLTHNDCDTYKCLVRINGKKCPFKTKQKYNMITHTNNIHYKLLCDKITSKSVTPIVSPSASKATYEICHTEFGKCPICKKDYDFVADMLTHIKNGKCYSNCKCPSCGSSKSGAVNLLTHLNKCYNLKMFHCRVKEDGVFCKVSTCDKRRMKNHLQKAHYTNKKF